MNLDYAEALQELSGPWQRGDRVKVAIQRAAKLAGISYWRAFDIWYGKARRVDADEAEKIQNALKRRNEEATRNELQDLRNRLIRLESILVTTDPDFHRPSIDLARRQIGQVGGAGGDADSAMARGKRR